MLAPHGAGAPIIDADAHVSIPEEMFAERLPASLRDRRPRLLDAGDGRRLWMIEGSLVPKPAGAGPGTPRGFNSGALQGAQDQYMTNVPGRLADMDREGVQVQVIYPDLLMVNAGILDPDLASAMARAYNDHIAERCAPAPERLRRVAVVALQDPIEAARELRRCMQELGCVGAVIPPLVGDRLLSHRDFEPFFEEADRLEAPIAIHGVTGVYPMPWSDLFTSYFGSRTVAVPVSYIVALVSLFDGHMLERYPSVRFGFFEAGGCSWAPFWIDRLDFYVRKRDARDTPASEWVRRGRLSFSCEPDEAALPTVVAALGSECILYGSDYPHGDSKWPETVSAVRSIPGLAPEAQERILGRNSLSFYRGLTVPAT